CSNIRSTIERYKKATVDAINPCTTQEINAQFYQQESKKLRQQIQMLQNCNRHLHGEGLNSLNVKELKQLENRIERGVARIRSKKHDIILAETEILQKRETQLEQENQHLRARIAESERLQQLSMVLPAQEYNPIHDYLTRNMLQLNMMEGGSSYQIPEEKSVQLCGGDRNCGIQFLS
ncbi:hypothetical protein Leryth_019570, partial [Lithospermum erythrorhizon]